ncbi:hypothetical protein EW146_g3574 [Bondarzewia mesenterica]|uniref:D-xylose 1-dehydrogenase (NADP(+), D-xylono-1,5-lactone-forming) n=1 Tax=Bondarzewia mesenterica TaxID=1095465 RepID=A0A4S4LXN5_9AGAM|nr:hypothetical protein EW146_g3574 [Bondarzewia mesenterica]
MNPEHAAIPLAPECQGHPSSPSLQDKEPGSAQAGFPSTWQLETPGQLLSPFNASRTAHLPTPQSPTTLTHYMNGTSESPVQHPPHTASTPASASVLQPRPHPQGSGSKMGQTVTPDSSPLMLVRWPPARDEATSTRLRRTPSPKTPTSIERRSIKMESPMPIPASSSHTGASETPTPTRLSSPFTPRPPQVDSQTPHIFSTPLPTSSTERSDLLTLQSPGQLPERPAGGEIDRIRAEQARALASRKLETEARRPEYLRRAKRALPTEDLGLGITETPIKGRRLELWGIHETSEESFEERLMAGGYGGYGSTGGAPIIEPPKTPQRVPASRALEWASLSTPGPPGPSKVDKREDQDQDQAPDEREFKKRRRLEAFKRETVNGLLHRKNALHPIEVEGRGRILLDVNADEISDLLEGTSPQSSSRRRGGRRKRRGAAAGVGGKTRGKGKSKEEPREVVAREAVTPNWPDAEYPWCLRTLERREQEQMEEAERMNLIERFLETNSEEESEGENEGEREDSMVVDEGGRKRAFVPTDPADARAVLLSKRSVRALAYKRQLGMDLRTDDEEVLCVCGGGDDGRELVQCDDCRTWYHLECLALRTSPSLAARRIHGFVEVYTTPGPTDPFLQSESPFDPTSTPSRGIKFATPKGGSNVWSGRTSSFGSFSTPSKVFLQRRYNAPPSASFYDDSLPASSSFLRGPPTAMWDDTPVDRSEPRPVVLPPRKLMDSPLMGRGVARHPAYVLDLESKFPLPGSFPEDPWRKRALELEDKLRVIHAVSESEHIELLALRSASKNITSPLPTPVDSTPNTSSSKKKKVKRTSVEKSQLVDSSQNHKFDLQQILTDYPDTAPPLSTSSVFLQALRTLQTIARTLDEDSDVPLPPPSIFVAVTNRCLESLGTLLASMVSSHSGSSNAASSPSDPHVLSTVTTVVPHVLWLILLYILRAYTKKGKASCTRETSVWNLDKETAPSLSALALNGDISSVLGAIFGPLAELILLPIVTSFHLVATSRLEALFVSSDCKNAANAEPLPSQAQQRAKTQLNPDDLLHCLRAIIAVLDRMSSVAVHQFPRQAQDLMDLVQMLKDRVALQTVRELNGLFSEFEGHESSKVSDLADSDLTTTKLTRAARIRRLARKDTLHWLCAVLALSTHAASGDHSSAPLSPEIGIGDSILREALSGSLAEFLRMRFGSQNGQPVRGGMDEVEEGMVLAVFEKAWGVGLGIEFITTDVFRELEDFQRNFGERMGQALQMWTCLHQYFYSSSAPSKHTANPLRMGILSTAKINAVAVIHPAQTHDDVLITAIASRELSSAKSVAKKYDIPIAYGSYEELLDSDQVDCVYISLPNGMHAEWAMRALEKGKHVLLEKPFTSNEEEAKRVVKCAEEKGLVVMEAFHWQCHPAAHAFKEIIYSGKYGKILKTDATMTSPTGSIPESDIRWRYDLAGGSLMDMTYVISSTRFVLDAGAPLTVTDAKARTLPKDDRVDEAMEATLLFEQGSAEGGTGNYEAESSIHTDMKRANLCYIIPRVWELPTITVTTERATVKLYNYMLPHLYHYIAITDHADGKTRYEKHYKSSKSHGEAGEAHWSTYRWQLECFVDKLRGRTPKHWITGQSSIDQMRSIDMVYMKAGLPLRPTTSYRA